jgi:hypothetical protein
MKTVVLSGFVASAIAAVLIVIAVHWALSGLDHIVVVGSR